MGKPRSSPATRSAPKTLIASLAVAGLLLAACGSSDDDTAGTGDTTDTAGDTVKVGVLQSLSGTMSISEVAVKNAEMLAIKEINDNGGVLGKQIEPIVEDGESEARGLRPEDRQAAQQRQGRRRLRRVDLGQPQGHEAGGRGRQGPALLPGAVRGPGGVAQHLLHRRHHQPADHPRPRLPEGAGPHQDLPGRLRLRLPPHRQQGDQGLRRGQRHRDPGRGVPPAAATPTPRASSRRCSTPSPRPCSTRSTATPTWPSSRSSRPRATRPTRSRPSRCPSPRRRSAASASTTSSATWWRGTTTRPPTTPANKEFVAAYKAEYGADRHTDDPIEAGYNSVYIWKAAVEKAGTFDVRHGHQGGRRPRAGHARGHAHRPPDEPPRVQDGPHRQDQQLRASSTRSGTRARRSSPTPASTPTPGRRRAWPTGEARAECDAAKAAG